MTDPISALKRQILQIDELRQSGALSADAATATRTDLERKLVDLVLQGATVPPAASAAAKPAIAAESSAPAPRPSGKLVIGLAAFVIVFGAAGYAWRGSHNGWSVAPGQPGTAAAASGDAGTSGAPHELGSAQIEGMINTLAEKLKAEPNNADGWLMLGRSYAALQRYPEAIPAFRKAMELQPKNALAMADLADAIAMTQQRSFKGEPTKLIEAALKAEPDNLKALALAGTLAYENKDLPGAIKHWERAVKAGPADNELVRQLQENINEVRKMAGMPVAEPAAAGGAAPQAAAAPAAFATAITGKVTLAPALAAKAAPDDTVFIYARAAEGSRMPLAILKKRVSDLPVSFTLDDSMAMSPAATLSGAKAVIVGARVSKSGQAMQQPGDLLGQSAVVAPGVSGLQITIGEESR
ncbi:MAG: tetratricopeptide repeat protein [Vitreoscilla sp.]|nr:tetratricopeptide repeat protein [Burkholderiales bacterium]MBP6337136.1 tetratricopeptide repeat protein [Vitreoscilla sp.]MBP6674203.1 tetratricopeptide repeat protein [Vitreoscilla sp.]